jgi:aminoglycoside phosphotransferase (APT) family kinase protein
VRFRAADLVAAEDQTRAELAGNTLSHTDLRADNLVVAGDRVSFVDWAHAQNAAPWVDATLLMADVVASGADLADGGEIDVVETLRQHPALAAGSFEQSWRLILAAAGALHGFSTQPSPPGLPTLRAWQAATSDTWLHWCQRAAPPSW